MSAPKSVHAYNDLFMTIALSLNKVESFTVPVGNVKAAKTMRLQLYGFRRAVINQDPQHQNPLLTNFLETRITITPEGDLQFHRNPYEKMFKEALQRIGITPPPPSNPNEVPEFLKPKEATPSEQDKVLMDLFVKKDK